VSIKNLVVQKNNILTQLHRTFIGHESRECTLSFITATLDSAYSIFNSERDLKLQNFIISDIVTAKIGIDNLRQTYALDNMFVCRLDSTIQKLNMFLDINQQLYVSKPIMITNA
jgi:hypothetical protein